MEIHGNIPISLILDTPNDVEIPEAMVSRGYLILGGRDWI